MLVDCVQCSNTSCRRSPKRTVSAASVVTHESRLKTLFPFDQTCGFLKGKIEMSRSIPNGR